MTTFEFLLALYVILAGLGLTLLIRSIGQLIEAREDVQTYWVHSVWVGIIFLVHITNWFAFWEFRHVAVWSVAKFLLLLSLPTLLYLVSHISVPEVVANGTRYDMRAYFYKRHRIIMGLLSITMVLNLVNDYFLHGFLEFSEVNVVRFFAFCVVSIGALFDNPRLQAAIAVVMLLLAVFTTMLLDNSIS